ncbi:MAG: ParB/RepB/Spo0J family partition protein [Candidatus Latescibacteria bacterium]|nr:ParB/RepB/Spo0J family partition protein [Candidatus Latescibacterota bacterium]
MGKKPVLGKGINALIPEYSDTHANGDQGRQVMQLKVDEIEPNPHQARTRFDEERLEDLMRSIKEKGIIQPITVNRVGQSYQIITGERRWRATKKAGLETIPAIIYEIESPQELMEISLIENIQRENLSPIEEAEGYRALMNTCFLTQEDVAQKVGKDRSTIANALRLLKLPLEIQDHLRQGVLQMGHARTLLGLEEEEDQLDLARRCLSEQMTVRDLERAVRARRTGRDKRARASGNTNGREKRDPQLTVFQEKLQHRYGTGVAIHRNAKKGHIAIEFYDDNDLERVLELLLGDQG